MENDNNALDKLVKQKSMGFPWLANAFAEYIELEEKKIESELRHKKHPALKAADEVKKAKIRRRDAEYKYRLTKYKVEYYEHLFPWLKDLIAESEDEEILSDISSNSTFDEDKSKFWLTPEEYSKLPTTQKYQLALDRYANRKKTKWEIGRDYERYVGYLWEKKGYKVQYQGIIDGFEDLGRDLIATKNGKTDVIQCKYWSKFKTIHEKHIFQLFGTTVEYWLKNKIQFKNAKSIFDFAKMINEEKINPIFVTSTNLSDTALNMSIKLHVKILQNFTMGKYPIIKCNISNQKEKIYHLPFDQQYDRVIIEPKKKEFYAGTVKEAENAGYRRAKRWLGEKGK